MNSSALRLCIAQLNPTLGDIVGNAAKALGARAQAHRDGAELVMLPELFLSGSPLQDLALRPAFQDACRRACEDLARATADGGPALLIGLPWREGDALYNAYALLDGGAIQSVRFKTALAEGGVREETRIFRPGPLPGPVVFRDKVRFGLAIGEDIAGEEVVECLAETGAELLLAPAASPYHRGIGDARMNAAVARVVEAGLPLVLLNQIGGEGELVFDGASLVLNGDRTLAHQLPAFQEAMAVTRWQRDGGQWRCDLGDLAAIDDGDEADYAALVLGLRDHAGALGAPGVVLDLSGHAGSDLSAMIAVDALGPSQVVCVTTPCGTATPDHEAQALVSALGVRQATASIAGPAEALEAVLTGLLAGASPRESLHERVASRACDTLLAAFAESLGFLLVRSSDKSEACVASPSSRSGALGGFNPLKDIYATQAQRLLASRKRWKPAGALGPDGALLASGDPDLRPASDRRGLPPDDNADVILELLVEQNMRVSEIVACGHAPELVGTIERLLRQSHSMRGQAAPGIMISARSVKGGQHLPAYHGFGDSGAPQHRPDNPLLKGNGRQAGEGFDG